MARRISEELFQKEVVEQKGFSLVEFYSDSCVACKKLAPVLGDAEDQFEDKVSFYKVNTNFDEFLAEKYDVFSNPTIIFFKDGEELDRKTGFVKKEELFFWLENNL